MLMAKELLQRRHPNIYLKSEVTGMSWRRLKEGWAQHTQTHTDTHTIQGHKTEILKHLKRVFSVI